MPPERIYIFIKVLPAQIEDEHEIVEVLHHQLVHEGTEMRMEDALEQEDINEAGGEEEEVIHHLVKGYGVQEEKVLDSMLLDDEGQSRSFIPLYLVYRLIILVHTQPL